MADFLDTTVDYLINRTDFSLPSELCSKDNSSLLFHYFNKLNNKDKEDVIWYCEAKQKRSK